MKIIKFLPLATLLSVLIFPATASGKTLLLQIDNPQMQVDSVTKPLDTNGTTPILKDGTTLVPIRSIVESFGGTVAWNSTRKMFTIQLDNKKVNVTIDSSIASVNDAIVFLASPATIINGKSMVPIRFVSENLGLTVNWEAATQTITITDEKPPVLTTSSPEESDYRNFYDQQPDFVHADTYIFVKGLGFKIDMDEDGIDELLIYGGAYATDWSYINIYKYGSYGFKLVGGASGFLFAYEPTNELIALAGGGHPYYLITLQNDTIKSFRLGLDGEILKYNGVTYDYDSLVYPEPTYYPSLAMDEEFDKFVWQTLRPNN